MARPTAAAALAALSWAALLFSGAATAQAMFGAMEDAPGLAAGGGLLFPRSYQEAVPAVLKRDSTCSAGFHSCLDINSTLCCPNDRYCIIDPKSLEPACCAIGSVCGSACNEAQYQCNATTTTTVAAATTTFASTSTFEACCVRRCTGTSMFLCPSPLGGGCCSFGQTCAPGGACLWTSSPPASTLVSMLPSGCTAGQSACASADGGGCCDAGRTCTVVTGQNYCALATVTPGPGISAVPQDGGGGNGQLSAGARAGIGVGVAVGASLVIGALVWFCLRRRREAASRGSGRGSGGVGGGPAAMSEVTSETGGGGPGGDYFGPDAAPGPFTDTGHGSSVVTTPGRGGAVPMEPHGPQDIVAPVEIDSTASKGREAAVSVAPSSPGNGRLLSPAHALLSGSIEGRFELYGSEVSPGGGVVLTPTSGETPTSGQPPQAVSPLEPRSRAVSDVASSNPQTTTTTTSSSIVKKDGGDSATG